MDKRLGVMMGRGAAMQGCRAGVLAVLLVVSGWAMAQGDDGRLAGRLARDDKDGDGSITRAEFSGPEQLFKRLDTDGDGVLIVTEVVARAKALQKLRAQRNGAAANAGDGAAAEGSQASGRRLGRRALTKPDLENVAYGDHERQVLDVYRAATDGDDLAPCMIWIHGGGFRRGSKEEGRLAARSFTQAGIHYITLNYRLSGQAGAPAAFEDCARALQFVRHNAEAWKIDKSRIAMGGGSAGAGLSQWVAYRPDGADPEAADPVSRESTRVSALILLNAQTSYDFRWIKGHIPGDAWKGEALEQLFGYSIEAIDAIDAERYRVIEECSPITHFSKDAPPALFFYRRSRDPEIAVANEMDGIHHPIFGLELKKLADEYGVACEVFSVDSKEETAFYHNRWNYSVSFLKKQFEEQK